MKKLFYLFLLINLLPLHAQAIYFPPNNNSTWESISPTSLGWDTGQLPSLQNYLQSKKSKAFIILKDGKIAVEWYFGTFTSDSLWYWASAGKTITAFLIGKAQEEGLLKISDVTSKYLGKGWTSIPQEKEDLITIRNLLTMTSGLDDGANDDDCTLKSCLQYKADAGTRWAYHSAAYTKLKDVIESAANTNENLYTYSRLTSKIGMNGSWFKSGYNYVFYSGARSMARFGLLVLNNFVWDKEVLLSDQPYLNEMINTSQQLNKSYGYLWWLNGKGSYMLPKVQLVFNTNLIPNALDDLIAALGKNDQKIYVVKPKGLVVIRMGDAAENSKLALSSFDNELWGEIMKVVENSTSVSNAKTHSSEFRLEQNYPNPFNPETTISYKIHAASNVSLKVYDVLGREIATLVNEFKNPGSYNSQFSIFNSELPGGAYFFQLRSDSFVQTKKMVVVK
ncbi:MAG: serine hydrolase [Ignavibacteria bacterium]|nr:serine hydrolase [Ignavibacteria bacterium]